MAASYPDSVKSFTTKVDNTDQIMASHINDPQAEIVAIETELLGDPIDISESSTVTGWADFTTKKIFYRVIGKMCFVDFVIHGNSNATVAKFTVPLISLSSGPLSWLHPMRARDNGTYQAGIIFMNANGTTIEGAPTIGGGSWTASGLKMIQGQLWYSLA